MEFKLDGTAEEALRQINGKHYTQPFATDGRKLFIFILVAVRTQVAYILILSMIVYLLDIINPNHLFVTRFKDLLNRYPSIDVRAMGFPANWENEDIWK